MVCETWKVQGANEGLRGLQPHALTVLYSSSQKDMTGHSVRGCGEAP